MASRQVSITLEVEEQSGLSAKPTGYRIGITDGSGKVVQNATIITVDPHTVFHLLEGEEDQSLVASAVAVDKDGQSVGSMVSASFTLPAMVKASPAVAEGHGHEGEHQPEAAPTPVAEPESHSGNIPTKLTVTVE